MRLRSFLMHNWDEISRLEDGHSSFTFTESKPISLKDKVTRLPVKTTISKLLTNPFKNIAPNMIPSIYTSKTYKSSTQSSHHPPFPGHSIPTPVFESQQSWSLPYKHHLISLTSLTTTGLRLNKYNLRIWQMFQGYILNFVEFPLPYGILRYFRGAGFCTRRGNESRCK